MHHLKGVNLGLCVTKFVIENQKGRIRKSQHPVGLEPMTFQLSDWQASTQTSELQIPGA